ncbi:MAG: phage portal protein [Bacteroides sp.]
MKILGLELRKASKKEISNTSMMRSFGVSLSSKSKPMLLSTVYRCVDVIGDSVAQLPLNTYSIDADGFKKDYSEHPAYHLLNCEPNEDMTRFTFFKTLVTSVLLNGNGYAYIERDSNGDAEQIIYLPTNMVTIVYVIDKQGIQRKRYQVTGFIQLVEPHDMIHILNFSYDGITGVSTLTHARQTLGISTDSEQHAAGFFKGGGNMAGLLTTQGRVSAEQKKQIYDEWERRTNPTTGNPNGIVVLEGGNQAYAPITVNPKDAQLLESREFNVIDICRFFSVSPVKAFDLSKSSYSTVEATQLAFLTDTIAPMLSKIELEIKRKVFKHSEHQFITVEFDTTALLRADMSSLAAYNNMLFQNGGITPNEIRKANNLSRLENGDETFVQVNTQPLKYAVMRPKEIEKKEK